MGKFKQLFLVTGMLLLCGILHAQVSFVFIPEVQGRTLDGLFQTRVTNAGGEQGRASLRITVTSEKAGQVVMIETPAFTLLPGTNPLPPGLVSGASIRFANNKIAEVCRQSGYFTEDTYEYCFELVQGTPGHGENVLTQQCFDYYLQPFSPLLLVTPAEGEPICDKRPSFFWQPLLPAIPGLQYRLILTEIKPGQAKTEALHYNTPIINQQFIQMPMLFYPSIAQELQEGREYAWQVTAYRQDIILATSEIWDFKISCNDSTAAVSPESFRDIEDLSKGNFYLASGRLMFAVKNIYDKTSLDYHITCITDPSLRIRKLPSVKLARGNNLITIPLEENPGFREGHYYLLTVKLPQGTTKELRFLYKNGQL